MDSYPPANTLDSGETLTLNFRRLIQGGPVSWLAGAFLLGCGLYALIFLYHGISLVLYPYDVDNSEAYLVYQGERIAEGHFLYHSIQEPPYLVDNYPPLYPLVESVGFLFTGVNFAWPRLISLLSTLTTAVLVGYWVFLRTRHSYASCLSGLLYLSFYHVHDWGALARVDALGVLLTLIGLLRFERSLSWKHAFPWLILALLTRQTLFAAPLAILATLLSIQNRKSAWNYLGILVATGVLTGVVLLICTAGQAWNHLILYNANEFRFSDVMNYINQWVRMYAVWGCVPLVILFAFYPKNHLGNSSSPLLFWFTLFSIGEALLCGKIGSAPNYWLSLVVATSVGVGILLQILEKISQFIPQETGWRTFPLLLFLCASLLQWGATWHWPHSRMMFSETPSLEDGQQVTLLQYSLSRLDGPILSDRAGVALMAGHPPVFDPFISTQLAREGKWDQTPLLNRIQNKEYSLVLLQFNLEDPQWDRERFTPEMIQSLQNSYTLDRKIVRYGSGIVRYYLYRPRP